jgi:hypothetical protein
MFAESPHLQAAAVMRNQFAANPASRNVRAHSAWLMRFVSEIDRGWRVRDGGDA